MNLKEVKDLVQEILRSDISEFELEHTGTKLRLRRGRSAPDAAQELTVEPTSARARTTPGPPPSAPGSQEVAGAGLAPAPPDAADADLHLVTSPIVGTFYRAPSPGSDPYVRIGDTIEEGTTLCVVEAMKLMNEIPSDRAGQVVRIYVENSHPVEFGQKLFGIRVRT